MRWSGFPPRLIAGIVVALFFGVALYLRVALPYDQVFVADWTKFSGADPWFFMRQVDNLVHNFPHLLSFDPYRGYPHGASVGSLNVFVYLLSGITWLVGLGSPTQHTVDMVGAYFPAILGALTIVPVYLIGKALFNRWAGVIAAGLIAILPGEFLARSTLGFTDRHALEVLLTAATMLFLILAVKTARQKELTFDHLRHRDWAVVTKPLICSLVAGVFFGIYLLTWKGAFVFVFIVFIYFIVQFIVDHLRGLNTDYLCLIGTITFFIALMMFLPVSPSQSYLASLAIALVTPLVLAGVSWLMLREKIRRAYYPLSVIGIGLAGLAVFYVVNPSLLSSILRSLGLFSPPSALGLTIAEMRPILFPGGEFSLSAVWGDFTTSFFLSFISLGILLYLIIKRGEADKTLFIVWSVVILALTLAMRRFAYHFAVNVALLTGYLSWLILQLAGFRESAAEPVEVPKEMERKAKKKKGRKDASRLTASWPKMTLGVIAVLFLVFYPNIGPFPGGFMRAVDVASRPQSAPSDAWCESLCWLRENTPDPFGDPDFYYELYETPFHYPETAYGVVAWWDCGYWIIRMGHRLPNCHPGGGARRAVARLFVAQDEASADKEMKRLGSKYVIIDRDLAVTTMEKSYTVSGKFWGVATYAGSSKEEFYDVYYLLQADQLVPVLFFYPEYYRSLAVRLYNFDGGKVFVQTATVISYEERTSREGEPYKQITDAKSFPSYEQAEAYVSSQESGNVRIGGTDPFMSPVPFEALEHYRLIYSSDDSIMQPEIGRVSLVKVFEYVRGL